MENLHLKNIDQYANLKTPKQAQNMMLYHLLQISDNINNIHNINRYIKPQLFIKAFPNIKFNGQSSNKEKSLYTVLSLALPFKNPLIGLQLDMKGIAVSQGSACSSGASKPSMVLMSIQTDEEMDTTTPLRVSFSNKTTKEDIDKLISALNEIVQENKIEIINN